MLAAGTKLGPYEIVGPLGAGGMGEVYRARDGRLDRTVAVKVIATALQGDPERLRRFETEARAAGALSHPNVVSVLDVGMHEGTPFLVSELVDGQTLRERLGEGALPLRKAVDFAAQIASGLAAAHAKAIVHRDLKPENLIVTRDGRVKILDFGLAKALSDGSPVDPQAATLGNTESGVVLGTAGYMAPEQVRGRSADARADIFALGAIFYEMLSGARAFAGATPVEKAYAVLNEDPPELSSPVPAAVAHIIRRCLEKNPDERLQSTHDLALHLTALAETSGLAAASAKVARRPRASWALGVVSILALAAAAFAAGRAAWHAPTSTLPTFQPLTFRRGTLAEARFAPDGNTVVYGAAWDGQPFDVYSTVPGQPESRALGFPDARLESISLNGEAALLLHPNAIGLGTLARASLGGGAPREIAVDIDSADWAPNGEELAVVHVMNGKHRLEMPAGKALYETNGGLDHARVSPRGDQVAVVESPVWYTQVASLVVVDEKGARHTLVEGWTSISGVAWAPSGREVWFTGSKTGMLRSLYAVTLAGELRLIMTAPAMPTLMDIARDGRVLLASENLRGTIIVKPPGPANELEITLFDQSGMEDLSRDGTMVLISEGGLAGGTTHRAYLRRTDGSPPIYLGAGTAHGISPDGKWVTFFPGHKEEVVVLLPTGPGEPRTLPHGALAHYTHPTWLPDGKRLIFQGEEPGHGMRIYLQDTDGGEPRAIAPEGFIIDPGPPVSPDGKQVVAIGPDKQWVLYPLDGGEPRAIAGLSPDDVPTGWSADGKSLVVASSTGLPVRVYRLDLATGAKTPWLELAPRDPAGVQMFFGPRVTPDGQAYAYVFWRTLDDLYLVEGLR